MKPTLILLAALACYQPVLAGTTTIYKSTELVSFCQLDPEACAANLKDLRDSNAKLSQIVKDLEKRTIIAPTADKPVKAAPLPQPIKAKTIVRQVRYAKPALHGWHHCKAGRTRNGRGVCGRWN